MTPASARGAAPKTELATAGESPPFSKPVHEAPDAGLQDRSHPGSVLGAQLAEPRQVLAIREVAAVLNAPTERRSCSATGLRGSALAGAHGVHPFKTGGIEANT
jgi:hypothetical protein